MLTISKRKRVLEVRAVDLPVQKTSAGVVESGFERVQEMGQINTEKRDMLLAAIEAGKTVVLAEFRSAKCEAISWRDEETGRAMKGISCNLYLETVTGEPFKVGVRQPDDYDVASFKPPFEKGALVWVDVRLKSATKGNVTIYGECHKL